MYGYLRDLFVEVLGYAGNEVFIDTAGARGRPDLTVFGRGGGNAVGVAWIVVEAKDERGAVVSGARRAALFRAKAKYITADTAWLVMADPDMLVARPVQRSSSAANDIELPLADLLIESLADAFAPLAAKFAGVPSMLQRFRDGDESLIATDKLTSAASDPDKELALAIARNTFFDTLAETTQLLQRSVKASLLETRARRQAVIDRVAPFRTQFREATFTPYPISIQGRPASREEAVAHRFARYDFTTVRGDILTGIYDRFLDRKQRKAQGEYYTPPSIARYILNRVQLGPEDEILDPACGSGTFLLERYQLAIGEAADMNLAKYEEARDCVERLAGNDINPFSSILTQIQLLWHLLVFGSALRSAGFPDLKIAERANSLVPSSLNDPSQNRFGEIDRSGYAAVVGNPPYVRPERGQDLDENARIYFQEPRERNGRGYEGITPDKNVYRLFIYRALDYWCRQVEDGAPGKLGFVIPLSFCGGEDAKALRHLFTPNGRWTIREIVDMELIWRHVFDADVLPMILIAEARAPQETDEVVIRLADESCVIQTEGAKRPTFDFFKVPEIRVAYARLFGTDDRILTRLSPERATIIEKLRAAKTFRDVAKPYWTRRRRGGQDVMDGQPGGMGQARWEEQRLGRYGLALRGSLSVAASGLDLYKGENIRTR